MALQPLPRLQPVESVRPDYPTLTRLLCINPFTQLPFSYSHQPTYGTSIEFSTRLFRPQVALSWPRMESRIQTAGPPAAVSSAGARFSHNLLYHATFRTSTPRILALSQTTDYLFFHRRWRFPSMSSSLRRPSLWTTWQNLWNSCYKDLPRLPSTLRVLWMLDTTRRLRSSWCKKL